MEPYDKQQSYILFHHILLFIVYNRYSELCKSIEYPIVARGCNLPLLKQLLNETNYLHAIKISNNENHPIPIHSQWNV